MSSSDRYQLLGRLAVGGMSEVFFAKQLARGGFSRLVIVKQLLPTSGEEEHRRLLDEARLSASITHENVVTVFDVGSRGGKPFVAMEYVHGVAAAMLLRHAIRTETALPILAVARIVQDAARGLLHAHEATDAAGENLGIVHRDVAPKNILVRKDGIAKIADFGIAMAHERLSHTVSGAVCGTLSYMAPEQARMEQVTAKTDQFSLGAVLWELLVGQHLFKTGHRSLTLKRLLHMPIDAPSTRRAGVPAALDDIVLRMLERDPAKRFDSMADVVDALEEALPGLSSDVARREVAALVQDAAFEELVAREHEMRSLSAANETDAETILWSSSGSTLAAPGPGVQSHTAHRSSRASKVRPRRREPRRRRWILAGASTAIVAASVAAFVTFAPPNAMTSFAQQVAARATRSVTSISTTPASTLAARRHSAPIVLRAGFAAAAARAGVDVEQADVVAAALSDIVVARIDVQASSFAGNDESVRVRRWRLDAALDDALVDMPPDLAAFARQGVEELSTLDDDTRPLATAGDGDDDDDVLPLIATLRANASGDLAAAFAAEARRAKVDASRAARLAPELEKRLLARIDLVERAGTSDDERARTRARQALQALDDDTRALIDATLPWSAADPVFVLWREYVQL